MGNDSTECQGDRFKKAAREADADMSKEEFARVIGGLAKPGPKSESEQVSKTKGKDDS